MFLWCFCKFIFVNVLLLYVCDLHLYCLYVCDLHVYCSLRLYLCMFILVNVYICMVCICLFCVVYQWFRVFFVGCCGLLGCELAYVYVHLRICGFCGLVSCWSSC